MSRHTTDHDKIRAAIRRSRTSRRPVSVQGCPGYASEGHWVSV